MAADIEAPKRVRRGARPLGDLVSNLVDPIVARKSGMTSGLLTSWPEIAGMRLSDGCRPEKLVWPRRLGEDDPFQPATLVIACEGAFVLRLQHETQELIDRINAFFGYPAVGKVRIVQRPVQVYRPSRKIAVQPLTGRERRVISEATARIDSPRLKTALEKLGETVLGRNAAARNRDGN